jgi:hypothetical protein
VFGEPCVMFSFLFADLGGSILILSLANFGSASV